MKKLIYTMLLSVITLATVHYTSYAQLSLSINIGTQPTWGPTGYDRADYYYLPDVESYYNVSSHQFIYLSNGRWIYSSALPTRYANYDLYSGYKVVVNRPRPYLNFSQDRVQYRKFKGYHGRQEIIRNTRDVRYRQGGNPHGMPPGQAKKFNNERGNDRRDDRGHDNGRGRNDKGEHRDNGRGQDDHGRGRHD
ncbi:hypothetical protein BDD43_4139 [Mucilaginibacter gracilis]|uniref:Uncharacterized protein n=1 Tax=Mucilaginibacter gracilis TaxID=423350 RepID=A0A495J6C1_9SPHI|nr:hypothetical protein [Mucilaginibacter gracilis]RKR83924.1 hypothetical protein BDD43_4139 [Mucilaginibacter gracilis]